LKSARAIQLELPSEQEIRPIILSIAERQNIKLTERMISFLVKRLPLQPLSFHYILSRLNDYALEKGRPINEDVLREAVSHYLRE